MTGPVIAGIRSSVRALVSVTLCAAGCAAVGSVVWASPAGAHGEAGSLALEVASGSEAGTVDLRARLVYENDREPVEGATVVVVATDSEGTARPAEPMSASGSGVYTARLRLPEGPWTLRVTAADPEAEAEIDVVSAAPSTTTAPLTTSPTTPSTAGGASSATGDRGDGDDEGLGGLTVVLGSLAVLGVAGGTAFAGFRRAGRRRTRPDRRP